MIPKSRYPMKTLTSALLLLLTILHTGAVSSFAQEDASVEETLGKLKLGQKAAAVIKELGEPASKGENQLWGATGEWNQEWKYPAKGLTLQMAGETAKGPKTLSAITASEKCELATSKQIKIGSTEAEVRKAYAKLENKEEGKPGETLVAGSIYGGVIFTFKKGKVVQIFIGAAAE